MFHQTIMASVAWLVLATVLWAQPGNLPPFVGKYVQKVKFYYTAPNPELGDELLQALLQKENLEHPWLLSNQPVLKILSAQLGDIAWGHPEILRKYEAQFEGASDRGKLLILEVLSLCGDDKTLSLAEKWSNQKWSEEVQAGVLKLTMALKTADKPRIFEVPAKQPKDLDLLWANFLITGDYKPVSRILDVFDLPADTKEVQTLQRVARWSLTSNLKQHPKLLPIIDQHLKERPAGSRKVLDEIILRFPEKAIPKDPQQVQ